jgi:hypothetical protein
MPRYVSSGRGIKGIKSISAPPQDALDAFEVYLGGLLRTLLSPSYLLRRRRRFT